MTGVFFGPRVCRLLAHAGAALITLAAGYALASHSAGGARAAPAFHDLRVMHPEAFTGLVVPGDPAVVVLARRLGSLEEAYRFVRDAVVFDPALPAALPQVTLRRGRASCLGKSTLLVSLYRALGLPAGSVRIVTGQLPLDGELVDHAWVDIEYGSLCLQQDATDLLGVHDFLRFPNSQYVDAFVRRELFCFNDQSFAAVSQLNRMRGSHP